MAQKERVQVHPRLTYPGTINRPMAVVRGGKASTLLRDSILGYDGKITERDMLEVYHESHLAEFTRGRIRDQPSLCRYAAPLQAAYNHAG